MPRSVGITVSAVVVIIGSAFTILGGAMMCWVLSFIEVKPGG